MFYIKRVSIEFGPFTVSQIKNLYSEGRILRKDIIRHSDTNQFIPIHYFFKHNHILLDQNKEKFGDILINFYRIFGLLMKINKYFPGTLRENKEFIIILLIVLIPVFGIFFIQYPILIYCIYGLYFASLWSVVLYKSIATDQVELKKIIFTFIGTVLISSTIISVFHATPIGGQLLTLSMSDNYRISFFSMFFGVGLVEEFCKQIIIYWIISSNKFVTLSRTAIFYGLISGIAFGIFEGIEYQIGLNKSLDIDSNYFFNLLRITSLPFFHAIWAGIGAYLISLSYLLVKYNYSLKILALLIPGLLHSSYNMFGFSPIGIIIIILSTALMVSYLTKSNIIGNQLNQI